MGIYFIKNKKIIHICEKWGPGTSPVVGGGEWIVRRGEGVVEISPPLSLHLCALGASPEKQKQSNVTNSK
jgi:hypothetical protein